MRVVGLVVLALLLAGCADAAYEADGEGVVYVVNTGAPAFAEIVSDEGVVWSARLATGEGRLANVDVPVRGCLDATLFAGFGGNEPDRPVRILRICDAATPERVEFSGSP